MKKIIILCSSFMMMSCASIAQISSMLLNGFPGENYIKESYKNNLHKQPPAFSNPIAREIKIYYVLTYVGGEDKPGDNDILFKYVFSSESGWDIVKNKNIDNAVTTAPYTYKPSNVDNSNVNQWAVLAREAQVQGNYKQAEFYKRGEIATTSVNQSISSINASATLLSSSLAASKAIGNAKAKALVEINSREIEQYFKEKVKAIGDDAPKKSILYLYVNHSEAQKLIPFTGIVSDQIIATLVYKKQKITVDESYDWYKTEPDANKFWKPPSGYEKFYIDDKYINPEKERLTFGDARYVREVRYVRQSVLNKLTSKLATNIK